MNAIGALARKHAWPMQVAVERALGESGVSLEGKNLLAPLLQQFVVWREEAKRRSAVEMVVKVVQQAGFLEEAMAEGEVLAREQFRYLDQFLSRAKRSVREHADEPGLASFLVDLAAEREAGETGAVRQDEEQGPDAIQLMTVHAAKGLEFRYVFVVSLLEQRFPSVRRSDTLPLPPGLVPVDAELDDHVAEERRLFYVAVTRAKEGLYLCSAEDYGGARARKPSRFVAEAGLTAEDRLEDLPEFSAQAQSKKEAARGAAINQAPLPKQFSFSQLAAFTNCPQQYKYAHLIKIPTPPRWQMTFGTCMHNTMQRFLEQVQTSQQTAQADLFTPATTALPPLSTLMGLYDQYFTDEWYESVDFREETRALGRTALLDLYARMEQVPPRPAFLEQGFTLKLDDILVKGRIDRIDSVEGGYEIIDYKTGEPKTELNADDKRQLTLYAIAAEECFSPPLKIVRCTYHYFKGNAQASFTPTAAEKEKLKLQIRETVAQMKASDFTATPNPRLCQYCDFKLICPFAIL
jgi:DNA helicase-2/ATP-dependent DNA helicase PcrA